MVRAARTPGSRGPEIGPHPISQGECAGVPEDRCIVVARPQPGALDRLTRSKAGDEAHRLFFQTWIGPPIMEPHSDDPP